MRGWHTRGPRSATASSFAATRFFDQNIVAILSADEALVVDTRSTPAQAREILDDLRELGAPPVGIVVNTHGH